MEPRVPADHSPQDELPEVRHQRKRGGVRIIKINFTLTMHGQILTNKDGGETVKILSHHQDVYVISQTDNHKKTGCNYTKEELIAYGWIFPVEKWAPTPDETYYVPSINDKSKYDYEYWTNDELDKHRLANNLVCRTKEEAIALTDKMLGAVTN